MVNHIISQTTIFPKNIFQLHEKQHGVNFFCTRNNVGLNHHFEFFKEVGSSWKIPNFVFPYIYTKSVIKLGHMSCLNELCKRTL
jgi:hypothetical protein